MDTRKLNIAFILPEKLDPNSNPFDIPLGPLKLEAYCRDIANFDFYIEIFDGDEDNRKYDAFAVTTFTSFESEINRVTSLLKDLKKYNIPILVGGNLPRYYKKLELYADWVCYYEGEKPFRRALLNILNNESLVHSKTYELLTPEELDKVPPINPYYYPQKVMPLQLGIGCPNNCIFCDSQGSQGKQLRHPSVNKIISDVDYYRANGILFFYIIDDTIFSDKEYYTKVFNYFKQIKQQVILMYVSPYLTNEELYLIADIALPRISFNVDACNERIFKLARKNGDFKRIPDICNILKSRDFWIQLQIVINYPFETEEDRQEAIQYYSHLNIDSFQAMPLEPMKNTPIYNMITEDKKLFLERGLRLAGNMNYIVNNNLRKR
jgi:radical SAM superfamily enzyme YgiQ (UPF0313 family)